LWVNNSSFSGGGSFGFNSGSSPVLSNDGSVLYLGDSNGNVAALDTTAGTDNWSGTVQLPSRILGHIAVGANDNVYVTSRSDGVYALQDNGASATELGSFQVGPNFSRQSPTVSAANQVFFTDNNGIVYSLDGPDPASWGNSTNLSGVNWQANMGGGSQSTPVLNAAGTVAYIGSNDNRLYAFTADPGDITVAVADGVIRKPANLSSIGTGYNPTETAPLVTFTGAGAGTLAATTTINGDGTLNVAFTGAPSDLSNVTMNVANGAAGVNNLSSIGSSYVPGDTGPAVTIVGANKGTLAGTTSINADGTLQLNFTGNPTDTNNVTVQIADGLSRVANLSNIGSGYDPAEAAPAVTITGANKNTLAATSSVNPDGTLEITFTGNPSDFGNLAVQIANGVPQVGNLLNLGSGYTPGDPAPAVTVTGTNKNTLSATSSINPDGTLNLNFTGNPSDTNNVGVQIANGLARVANLSNVGTGYDPSETAPAVAITGASTNTLAATSSINPDGSLNLAFTGNPSDFSNLAVQAANGVMQTPAALTGIGANHDPLAPPVVTITGADKGTLAGTATVNGDGTVDIAFSGTPSGTGPLNVQIPGGSSSTLVSNKYLLSLDGDLWDYSVSEFDNFTELISDARAQNGAEQNSLNTFWNLLSTNVNELERAAGRIKDADYAAEMTKLGRSQILSQSGAMMLGRQNRITSEALLTIQRLQNML
jgi:flagellin-like hook-associated protein FlgL